MHDRSMNAEEIQGLVSADKINTAQAEALVRLTPGTFCAHKSWGIGRIQSLDAVFDRLIVDFPNKPGHSMQLAYAVQSLQPLSPDHIAARKGTDLANLQTMAQNQPLELLRIVLTSHGGRALTDEIAADLCGSVIAETTWKRWWEHAKHAARADGHFSIPTKKTEPLVLRSTPQTREEALLESFHNKHGLKEKIAVAEQWRNGLAQWDPKHPIATEFAASIAQMLERHPPRHAAVALEAIWLLQDFDSASPVDAETLAIRANQALKGMTSLAALADDLPAQKFSRLLVNVRKHSPSCTQNLLELANESPARRIGEIVDFLSSENQAEVLQRFFAQSVENNSALAELLLWLAKNRVIEKYSSVIAPALGPRFLATALGAIEQDAMNSPRRSRHPLREFLARDDTFLPELLSRVPEDEARQATERILRSNAIDEPAKRSLLGRMIESFPGLKSLVVSTASAKTEPLYVSVESLARRQAEYENLINKEIPQNAREIAVARSYGDLSENHEFKSAKERQGLLLRRKAEMENELALARETNFEIAGVAVVSMGTRVEMRDEVTGEHTEYAILGAWDSDPTHGVISYLSPIAKALMNRRVEEDAEVETEGKKRRVRIVRIEPWSAAKSATASAAT